MERKDDIRGRQRETQDLVDEWVATTRNLESRKRDLSSAECAATNATNELGKRIDPGDMKDGESIAIWVRIARKAERVIVVTRESVGNYKIAYRGTERSVVVAEET